MDSIELIQIIAELRSGSISEEEYRIAVQSGRLARFEQQDDLTFASAYPDHPMAMPNRQRRIAASDQIRFLIQEDGSEFPVKQVRHLHVAVFDCCAAVRHSVIKTLAILRRAESIAVLEEVASQERESEWVRSAAQDAVRVLKGEMTLAESRQLSGLAPSVTGASSNQAPR